mgnify:FL=1
MKLEEQVLIEVAGEVSQLRLIVFDEFDDTEQCQLPPTETGNRSADGVRYVGIDSEAWMIRSLDYDD